MKRLLTVSLLIAALLAACGPAPTAQATVDVDATSKALSGTMVAATLAAESTANALPTGTSTPALTDTPTETELPTVTETLTPTITPTSVPLNGTLAPLDVSNLKTGLFRINNTTGQDLNISIYGVSDPGDKPVYYQYGPIKYSFNFRLVWGNYSYVVQIGTKNTIKGTFRVYNYDKTTMNVYNNRIVIAGP